MSGTCVECEWNMSVNVSGVSLGMEYEGVWSESVTGI